jgi:hypothetical protein
LSPTTAHIPLPRAFKLSSPFADITNVLTAGKTLDVPGQAQSYDHMRFVARQPIFDRSEKVFGYELLFRNGLEQAFHGDKEVAARSTLDSSLLRH